MMCIANTLPMAQDRDTINNPNIKTIKLMRQSQAKQNVTSFSRESCEINNLPYLCPTLHGAYPSPCVRVYV